MLYLDGYGYDDDENLRLCRALRDSDYKTSTKRVRIKAIRGVFRYIREELEVPVKDPTKGMETPEGEPRSRIPTHDELMTLLLRIDHERFDPDSLFVRLLIATGARCSTILHLRPCDMGADHRLSLYNVKCGRKYKYPQLITDAETLKLWDSVCKGRNPNEQIFDSASANRLGARMRRWFGRDADGQTISAHSLRHLKATELARKGCPIKLAALVLDASPAVIMRTYQNLSQEDVDNVMRNF
jgi:integrase